MELQDYFGSTDKYVKELISQDFDSTQPWKLKPIKGKPVNGMVLFYAPWCGHCKAVAPEWKKAAQTSAFCDFYAFNCEKQKGHFMKIKEDIPDLIQGFPTIIYYKNGSPEQGYDNPRSASSLIEFCMNKCQNCKKL